MPDMADKLGVGTEVRELKIGKSFLSQRKGNAHHSKSGSASRNGASNSTSSGDPNGADASYHTIRYDFKPASSNTSSTGFLEVDEDNSVSVKIPHERGGETNFSGHQKEATTKDCLLIIDHVTGEITLEKLSSQIMVKKTRATKPDPKDSTHESSENPLPSNSNEIRTIEEIQRNPTPTIPTKYDHRKPGANKSASVANKASPGRGNLNFDTGSSKNVPNHNVNLPSNSKKGKSAEYLSSDDSSGSSTCSDSDSDSESQVGKGTTHAVSSGHSKNAGRPNSRSGSPYVPSTGVASVSKHSKQQSPSNSRIASPNRKIGAGEVKQPKPIQSLSKSPSQGGGIKKLSDLNEDFESDSSDNEDESNSPEKYGEKPGLGTFTIGSTQVGRSVPNLTPSNSKFNKVPTAQKQESQTYLQSKHSSNSPSAAKPSAIQSMPQFLNDDLELSESDSDS